MKKGFTLIELLVVVLIIGILAAIAVPQYQKAVARSRMAEGWLILKNMADASERFFLQHGRYPGNEDLDALDIEFPGEDTILGSYHLGVENDKYRASFKYYLHIVANHVYIKKLNDVAISQQITNEGLQNKYTCRFEQTNEIGKKACQMVCKTKNPSDFYGSGAQYCWFDSF